MSLSLKPVASADEEFLYLLYATTRREEVALWGWPQPQQEAFLLMQFKAKEHHYRSAYPQAERNLVLYDGQAIGQIVINRDRDLFCLVDITLLPAQRNCGLGTELIRKLVEEAAAANAPVQLHVVPGNPARKLYERLGFQIVEAAEMSLKMVWSASSARAPKGPVQPSSLLDFAESKVFEAQIKTCFNISSQNAQLFLLLVEVASPSSSPIVDQFSLLFRGPRDPQLPQGTFTVTHQKLGQFPLFLVPLGPDHEGMTYQAVFTRLRNAPAKQASS